MSTRSSIGKIHRGVAVFDHSKVSPLEQNELDDRGGFEQVNVAWEVRGRGV